MWTNGWQRRLFSDVLPTPEELVGQFFALVEPPATPNSYAVLPYIKGLTEPLTRILKKNGMKVFNKQLKTLKQEFPSPKDRPTFHKQKNVVYKIRCKDCPWNYVGETGRCFETRKKEHVRNTKTNVDFIYFTLSNARRFYSSWGELQQLRRQRVKNYLFNPLTTEHDKCRLYISYSV